MIIVRRSLIRYSRSEALASATLSSSRSSRSSIGNSASCRWSSSSVVNFPPCTVIEMISQ